MNDGAPGVFRPNMEGNHSEQNSEHRRPDPLNQEERQVVRVDPRSRAAM
jgi:hypothetical protein